MLRVHVSHRDPVSRARADRLIATLSTGPISVRGLAPRRGPSCAALTITPPLAGWPPVRPRSRDRDLLAAYQAACAAWLAHLQREVEQRDSWQVPSGDALAQVRASQAEQQLVAALRRAGLPVEIGCAIPTGSAHPDAQYAFYWPDGAIRDAAAWLLVDVECDGRDHREQGRQERDRRRDLRFRRRGWYVARIDLDEAHGSWAVAAAHDLTRLVQQHQEAVSTANRAGRAAHAQAPAR